MAAAGVRHLADHASAGRGDQGDAVRLGDGLGDLDGAALDAAGFKRREHLEHDGRLGAGDAGRGRVGLGWLRPGRRRTRDGARRTCGRGMSGCRRRANRAKHECPGAASGIAQRGLPKGDCRKDCTDERHRSDGRPAGPRRRHATGLDPRGGAGADGGVPAGLSQRHGGREGHDAGGLLRGARTGDAAVRLFRARRERWVVRGRHDRRLGGRCADRDRYAERGSAGAGRLVDGRLDRAADRPRPPGPCRRPGRHCGGAGLHRDADVGGDDAGGAGDVAARRRAARAEPIWRAVCASTRADRGRSAPICCWAGRLRSTARSGCCTASAIRTCRGKPRCGLPNACAARMCGSRWSRTAITGCHGRAIWRCCARCWAGCSINATKATRLLERSASMTQAALTRDRPIVRARAALLVIDVQNGSCNPTLATGQPEFHAAATTRVIPNIARLLGAFRAARLEVIHTVIENLTADGRDRSLDYKLSTSFTPRAHGRRNRCPRFRLLVTRSCCRRPRRRCSTRRCSTTCCATSASRMCSSSASSPTNASTTR